MSDEPHPQLLAWYRTLLALYPPLYRRQRGDEILQTLLDGALSGQRRPAPREAFALVVGALDTWSGQGTTRRSVVLAEGVRMAGVVALGASLEVGDAIRLAARPWPSAVFTSLASIALVGTTLALFLLAFGHIRSALTVVAALLGLEYTLGWHYYSFGPPRPGAADNLIAVIGVRPWALLLALVACVVLAGRTTIDTPDLAASGIATSTTPMRWPALLVALGIAALGADIDQGIALPLPGAVNYLVFFLAALAFMLMLALCLASVVYGVVDARVPMATAGLVLPMALSYFSRFVVDYQFGVISTTLVAALCVALVASATVGVRRRSRL